MINISFYDNNLEEEFYNWLDTKVKSFNKKTNNNIPITRSNNTEPIIDCWLSLPVEEMSKLKNKEDLTYYLRTKQRSSRELLKRAIEYWDRFESYMVTMDLALSFLEKKPMEDSKSIATENDIALWLDKVSQNLKESDLDTISKLIAKMKEFK